MRVPRIVFQTRQTSQPYTDSDDDLEDHDADYLRQFLESSRRETYTLEERPDRRNRNSPAPDYLFRENGSGLLFAVERSVLIHEDQQAEMAHRLKAGHDLLVIPWNALSPKELDKLLWTVIERKLSRGQLLGVDADVRILLLRNRLDANLDTYLGVSMPLELRRNSAVDHIFVIVRGQLVEL